MAERPPHGLYATEPSPDTLYRLSTGTLSPDLRFRSAMDGQDGWIVRVDGAWFWQIAVAVKSPLQWTPQSTLLFQDSGGIWHEANPDTALVAALPAALQTTTGLAFSPSGATPDHDPRAGDSVRE